MRDVANSPSEAMRRLLQRAELRALIGGSELAIADCGGGEIQVLEPGKVVITPEALLDELAATRLRFGLELAWLKAVRPARATLTTLIAARTAALFLALEGPSARAAASIRSGSGNPFWQLLNVVQGACPPDPDISRLEYLGSDWQIADLTSLSALWPFIGPAEYLMTTGGDERLRVDPDTGLNKYGCSPRPRPWAITFASSTASSISERGYGAAEACRRRILRAAINGNVTAGLRREADLVRAGILNHWRIEETADAVLAASGTDAALIATALVRQDAPDRPINSILMSASETGSGVPHAVCGRHFAAGAALGAAVPAGSEVADWCRSMNLATIAVRHANGYLRGNEDIAGSLVGELDRVGTAALTMLHIIDGSKTGLLAPAPQITATLMRRFGPDLAVMVDACQGRLGQRQMGDYIASGWPVLVTGSKFFTGPPFCGALLLPKRRFDLDRLPAGLDAYSCSTEWPSPAPASTSKAANPGLLLRWAASLAEMRDFSAVPASHTAGIIERFGAAARRMIDNSPTLIAVPTKAPVRLSSDGWDMLQTVFPFAVRDPHTGKPYGAAELGSLYHALNTDLSGRLPDPVAARACHIGQPVNIGPYGALRVSAGARLISGEPSHAALSDAARIDRELDDLALVFDKLAVLLRDSARVCEIDEVTGRHVG